MEELKGSGLWDRLFGDLDRMATPSLEALLKQAREVNTSAWDPRNVKEYQDAIKRLEEAIHSRSPFKAIRDDWKRLLESIGKGDRDGMAAALEGMDTSVQSLTSSLDTIAGGIGDILGDEAGYAAGQVAELTSALSGFVSGAAKIAKGDILGGVTSVIGGIGKIFSMGRQVKEMNRQAREEQQNITTRPSRASWSTSGCSGSGCVPSKRSARRRWPTTSGSPRSWSGSGGHPEASTTGCWHRYRENSISAA